MSELRTAPGPKGGWLLGSTLDFKDSPLEFCVYVQRAYGDVARFKVGPSYWYLVSHPADVHEIMTKKAHIFLKPKIARRLWSKFLGDGILTSEHEVWRRQNRTIVQVRRRPVRVPKVDYAGRGHRRLVTLRAAPLCLRPRPVAVAEVAE